MKKKTGFSQIILLVILAVVCVILTIGIALLAGFCNTTLFDFSNINIANVIPVLIVGGFVSCVVIGIAVLFIARSVFLKVRDYLTETDKNNGGNEK